MRCAPSFISSGFGKFLSAEFKAQRTRLRAVCDALAAEYAGSGTVRSALLLVKEPLALQRADTAACCTVVAFGNILLKLQQAEAVEYAEDSSHGAEAAPEAHNERSCHKQKNGEQPSRIYAKHEVQDHVEYQEEPFEPLDEAVEPVAPLEAAYVQFLRYPPEDIKQEANRAGITAPGTAGKKDHQTHYAEQHNEPCRHGMPVMHHQEDEPCKDEKIEDPYKPASALEALMPLCCSIHIF